MISRRTLAATLAISAATGTVMALAPTAGAAPVPLVTSDNVSLLTTVPVPGAISIEFARTGDFAYVSSLTGLTVLDTTDPEKPVRRGTLPVGQFENEAMTYGERRVNGKLTRFVILAVDLAAVGTEPDHNNVDGRAAVLVDVTDPDAPKTLSKVDTTTSTHTVQCVSQADCRYAYTAGTGGKFSILDFTDLAKPKELKTVLSSAAGPSGPSSPFADGGAGHYWDFDGKLGWHTGSGGAQAFDVTDPTNPTGVTGTNAKGRQSPYNDFILHNSMRPNAARFRPGAPASIKNGNVLIVTEEDYANDGDEVLCDKAGTIQTWYVPDLDAAAYLQRNPTGALADKGTVRPLDITNVPNEFGGGLTTPLAGFCSAHWFDVHQDGFVAQGYYGEGLRILDVRNPKQITQIGYSTSVATEVWDAYWVPQRGQTSRVVLPGGKKTNLVYTADAARGMDVYEITLPTGAAAAAIAPGPGAGVAPGLFARAADGAVPAAGWVLGLAFVTLGGAVLVTRRRSSALA